MTILLTKRFHPLRSVISSVRLCFGRVRTVIRSNSNSSGKLAYDLLCEAQAYKEMDLVSDCFYQLDDATSVASASASEVDTVEPDEVSEDGEAVEVPIVDSHF